jgi:hypothetical protein
VGRVAEGDVHYEIVYWNTSGEPRNVSVGVEEVQETHWVLHEIELKLRRRKEQYESRTPADKLRVPPFSYGQRIVNGQRVFYVGGGGYVWTSGPNRVVTIAGGGPIQNADGTFRPVGLPQEFLDIYFPLLPSTLPEITFDAAHEQQFIRDAFDREFEHGARYLALWQTHGAVAGRDEYAPVSGIIERIVDRKSRYFGGPSARERDRELAGGARTTEQARRHITYAFLKGEYDQLKVWWDAHRTDPIDLSRGEGDFDRDGRLGTQ